jgi:hypothetical protein
LTIPNNIVGAKKIVALGITGPDEGVFSQPVVVDVEIQTPLTDFEVDPINLRMVGDQDNLTVIGEFSDGTEADITHSSKITYQTNDATVANVSSDGVVMATGKGTTSIVVRYADKSATVPVTVRGAAR